MRTLTVGAYSAVRDVYSAAILPLFRESWRKRTGEDLRVRESYMGSGAEARQIAAGFEADVAVLSLEPDIQAIVDAGLIHHDWRAFGNHGMVTRSMVVIGVRPGNPKNIHDWSDLARPDVEVLTPDVGTSGSAMWNVLAIVGAVRRGRIEGAADPETFLASVLARVPRMDAGAHESMTAFLQGSADAIITYENEIVVAREEGKRCDLVVPQATLRVESPVAVVDAWAEKHGNEDLARAFVEFLLTPEIQALFGSHGLRPVAEVPPGDPRRSGPTPMDLFSVDDVGGWAKARLEIFDSGGVYPRALALRDVRR